MKRVNEYGVGKNYTTWDWTTLGYTTYNHGSYCSSIAQTVLTGYDTPRFTARKNAGELLPCTPFLRVELEGSRTGSMHRTYTGSDPGNQGGVGDADPSWSDGQNDGWIPSDVQPSDYTSVNPDKLVQSAAASIMGKSFDALTFLVELKDTLQMAKQVKKKLTSLINEPKLYKYRDAWLEGRYGWRPLIGDLQSLYELSQTTLNARKRWTQMIGYNEAGTSQYTTSSLPVSVFSSVNCYYNVTDSWELSQRGFIAADVELPNFRFNPILTAWELIPLSFVVDWFVGVGTALDAMEFSLRSTKSVASYGYKLVVTRDTEGVLPDVQVSADWLFEDMYSQATCTVTKTQRIPRKLTFTPHSGINLDWFKAIDLLALVSQRSRRH